MKLHVVGHTDNVGSMASNMELSKQRAAAVVSALVIRAPRHDWIPLESDHCRR